MEKQEQCVGIPHLFKHVPNDMKISRQASPLHFPSFLKFATLKNKALLHSPSGTLKIRTVELWWSDSHSHATKENVPCLSPRVPKSNSVNGAQKFKGKTQVSSELLFKEEEEEEKENQDGKKKEKVIDMNSYSQMQKLRNRKKQIKPKED